MPWFSKVFISALSALLAVSCSTAPEKQFSDPYEGLNRKIFNFNEGVDNAILVPVSKAYVAVTPDPVEKGVSNFFDNITYPTVVINQFLQGKLGDGVEGIGRFSVNTTLGIVGLFDVATGMGLEERNEDFGQTFAKWGFGSGPYIVVPIRGGMTLRDGAGAVTAIPTRPTYWIEDREAKIGFTAAAVIDTSASLLEQRALISGDRYLFVRDAYMQRRQYLIEDGAPVEEDPFLDD